jgi:hypothetical protein
VPTRATLPPPDSCRTERDSLSSLRSSQLQAVLELAPPCLEVNGGSDFILAPSLKLKANDWAAFKALAAMDKAAGEPLKIASQFGSVQDNRAPP